MIKILVCVPEEGSQPTAFITFSPIKLRKKCTEDDAELHLISVLSVLVYHYLETG